MKLDTVVPPRKSVAESKEYLDAATAPKHRKVYIDSIKYWQFDYVTMEIDKRVNETLKREKELTSF